MTEDPIKLYVVVMGILLAVLGIVTFTTWQQAGALETALDRVGSDAKNIQTYAEEVQKLTDQLTKAKIGQGGPRALIENAARSLGIAFTKLGEDPFKRIGNTGIEERYRFDFTGGRDGQALTRQQIAKFCQAVEYNSQGLLKTLEIDITRSRNQGAGAAGTAERVLDDRWTGKIIFGRRRVE